MLAASIVGSGELILTTTLGAKVGYTFMWMVLLSCLIKSMVRVLPGPVRRRYSQDRPGCRQSRSGPRWRVGWVVWAWAAMVFMTLFQITGKFIGVSQTMNSGGVPWRAQRLPCPVDPLLLRSCMRLRRVSQVLYGVSVFFLLLGAISSFWSSEVIRL